MNKENYQHKKLFTKFRKIFAKALHIPTMIMLICIALLFCFLIFKEFIHLFNTGLKNSQEILEEIFLIFLYIEIIASVKIYFEENFHFPLKFFIYIGITDIIRHIIVFKENPDNVLLYAIALLLLIVSLGILEIKNMYLKNGETKKEKEEESDFFEL